jgi:multisubunit Na+/H+ antiporter MnhC subunit
MNLSLIVPFLLLVFILISFWFLVETKKNLILKIVFVAILDSAVIAFYCAMPSYFGWAAPPPEMPTEVVLYQAIVREPVPSIGDPGAIYVWLEPIDPHESNGYRNRWIRLFSYTPRWSEPRAFTLPYSDQLRDAMETLKEKFGQGGVLGRFSRQMFEGKENAESGRNSDRPGSGNGKKNDGRSDGSLSREKPEFYMFHELPPSYFLPKE